MKAETLKGLKLMREGIDLIIQAAESSEGTPANNVAPKAETKAENTTAVKEAPTVDRENLTREQLDGMTYNDLKKLAKELGVSAVGARPEITDRILGVEATPDEEVVDVSDAPAEEPTGDEIADKVRELTADMSVEDIADILSDVGVSAKGKKEALIEKLIKAVKDGLISLEDDEEAEAEVEPEETEEPETDGAEEAVETEEDDEEYDPTNDPENPKMTEERKTALVAFDESTRNSVKNGEISVGDMKEFLAEFHEMPVDDLAGYSDEEILDFYIDAASRFIADDGEIVEEEAYTLNGEPACCGHVLSYDEKKNSFHCDICGNDYEAE